MADKTPPLGTVSVQQRIDASAKSAADQEKERYRTVMANPLAQGNGRDLALKLLGTTELSPAEIVACLEKVPVPEVMTPAPGPAQALSPREALLVSHLGYSQSQIEFERLYELGAETAKMLLGKK